MENLYQVSWLQVVGGFVFAAVISLLAMRLHSLNLSGAIGATVLGTIVFGLGGLPWAILLLTFFITSSVLSKMFRKRKAPMQEKFSKSEERDLGQVAANGVVAAIFVILHIFFPQSIWTWLGYAGMLAAVNADTWGTELGVLSPRPPRLITTGKTIEAGSSGGVSPWGMLASYAGAFIIALLAVIFIPREMPDITFGMRIALLVVISLAGLGGSLFDSYLGASAQSIYYCPNCKRETERHPLHTCGTRTELLRGSKWFNNDWVNSFASLMGSVLAIAVGALLPLPDLARTIPAVDTPLFALTSPAFEYNQPIPVRYSCDGENISPPLSWSEVPGDPQSFALIMEDPDAPGGTFTHWVLYNIPGDKILLPENVPQGQAVAGLGAQGPNSANQAGYFGPCPPAGAEHRYIFNIYALSSLPNLPPGLDADDLRQAIEGNIVGLTQYMGTFQRE